MPRARANEINLSLRVRGIAKAVAGLKGFSRAATRSGRVTQRAFMGVSGVLRGIKGLIRRSARFLSLAFVGASAAAIKYSGSLEMLKLRLRAASASAEEAEASFKEMIQFSTKTPFTPQEVLQAGILMKSFGLEGEKALDNVGSAALIMGRNFMDVVLAIGSMKTEPLRRLGIEFRRVGETGTFVFRDKLGKEITRTSKGIQDTRQTLIDILGMKFGGGLEAASRTFPGLMTTFVGHLQFAFASFGDGFMALTKATVSQFNKVLEAAKESGQLQQIGAGLEAFLAQFAATILAFVTDWRAAAKAAATLIYDAMVFGAVQGAKILRDKAAFAAPRAVAAAGRGLFGGRDSSVYDERLPLLTRIILALGETESAREKRLAETERRSGMRPREAMTAEERFRSSLENFNNVIAPSLERVTGQISKWKAPPEVPVSGAKDLGDAPLSDGGPRNIGIGDLRRWDRLTRRRETQAERSRQWDQALGMNRFAYAGRGLANERWWADLAKEIESRGQDQNVTVVDERFYLKGIYDATKTLAGVVGAPSGG